MACETPVVLIIFNRPSTTSKVFDAIRRARPTRLFVVADGPRLDREGEAERCNEARAVTERVDWPCEVLRHYSDVNMGCGPRPASGISWAFDHVDRAIILEDDCLPHPSFFSYCSNLLERHKDDERVMCIGGYNFQNGISRGSASYFFSKYPHNWGWATWRRAWRLFDYDMTAWPEALQRGLIQAYCPADEELAHWSERFSHCYQGASDIWDYRWMFACWIHHGLTAVPNVNLISNIGFGPDATHTVGGHALAEAPVSDIGPIRHPASVCRDAVADNYIFAKYFGSAARAMQRGRVPARLFRKVMRMAGRASNACVTAVTAQTQ